MKIKFWPIVLLLCPSDLIFQCDTLNLHRSTNLIKTLQLTDQLYRQDTPTPNQSTQIKNELHIHKVSYLHIPCHRE